MTRPTMTRERAILLAADQGDTVSSVLGAVMVKAITREEGGEAMRELRASRAAIIATDDDVTVSMHGVEVTICKSSGSDGASVVFIDTATDDVNDDGTPTCRVYLNDDHIYVGTPRADDDEEGEAA